MKFDFQNPTRIIFETGSIEKLGKITAEYGSKALLVTGGGSVKKSGTFDKAVASLKEAGIDYAECAGVEPNPRNATVIRGRDTAKAENCNVIIALGGGSVMDASKVMSAAYYYDGDPWDMIFHGQENVYMPSEALPVITVPTMAATASEMNCGAVITNEETKIKSFIQNNVLYPKVAVVDSELTVSLPADQTAYGVCDIITHVTETYFNGTGGTPIQDRFAEGIIKTAMEYGERAVNDGSDIEARKQVQWASIVALNGWIQAGTNFAPPAHMIEHALSAHHDIAHGAGLAIVSPAWMRRAVVDETERYVEFARNVFDIDCASEDDMKCASLGIDKLEAYFKRIGCPTRLSEVGIGDELLEQYAEDSMIVVNDGEGRLLGNPKMTKDDIVGLLKSAL